MRAGAWSGLSSGALLASPRRSEPISRRSSWPSRPRPPCPLRRAVDADHAADIVEGRDSCSAVRRSTAHAATHSGTYADGDVGPVLTGWGSREWLLGMLHDPSTDAYYGEDNDRMPLFGVDELLTEAEMRLVADWLRGDWAGQRHPGTVVHLPAMTL